MEPLSGGMLAVNPPAEIQRQWRKSGINRTAADWALQWVWNQPEVSVALSGMNAMAQVQENLESAANSGPNTLNARNLSCYIRLGNCTVSMVISDALNAGTVATAHRALIFL